MADAREDYGGGRTQDEAFLERLERDWGYADAEPSACSVCAELVQFSQGRLRHSLPPMPRPVAPLGTEMYTVEEMAWGTRLGLWTLRTSDHQAVL